MGRLIDADKLHREIMELAIVKGRVRIAKIINMVEMQPTVDAAPVVHGRFVPISEDEWRCSCCGDLWVFLSGDPKLDGGNYCPSCGAKMDDGNESEND